MSDQSDQSPTIPPASLPYVVLDVFTDRPYAGNPLAVVMDAEALSTDQLQRVAREFNLSETAFPMRPTDTERAAGADYRLRIFTPEVELPFAGHPSVGSAWWLMKLGRIAKGVAHQQCGAGLLPVEVGDDSAALAGGAASVSDPVDTDRTLKAVGLGRDTVAHPEVRVASAGLAYAVLFVKPGMLSGCRPDMVVLREAFSFPRAATGVYVVEWDAKRLHAKARMFAGDIGVPEDPATGSAALALGASLVSRGELADGATTFTIDQGVDMGRPSLLTVTCDVASGAVERLQVSGGAVLVSEGRIAIPGI